MTDEKNNGKEYAIFTGCVFPIQLPHFEVLSKKVFSKLGIETVDLDFSCCPYYGIKDIDIQEWLVIAARNLALAEEKDLDIISVCNGCSQTLIEAHHELQNDRDLKKEVNAKLKKIGKTFKGKKKVYHFLMVLEEMKEKIESLIKIPLDELVVGTHTGCHLLRPSKIIGYDDPEDPKKFDEFVNVLGARTVNYNSKSLCCGSEQINREQDMSLAMMKEKISDLHEKKVDILSVCCPSCFQQFDKNQVLLKRKFEEIDYGIPVVHILQLLGLAMGMSTDEVYLSKNRSVTPEFIEKLNSVLK